MCRWREGLLCWKSHVSSEDPRSCCLFGVTDQRELSMSACAETRWCRLIDNHAALLPEPCVPGVRLRSGSSGGCSGLHRGLLRDRPDCQRAHRLMNTSVERSNADSLARLPCVQINYASVTQSTQQILPADFLKGLIKSTYFVFREPASSWKIRKYTSNHIKFPISHTLFIMARTA